MVLVIEPSVREWSGTLIIGVGTVILGVTTGVNVMGVTVSFGFPTSELYPECAWSRCALVAPGHLPVYFWWFSLVLMIAGFVGKKLCLTQTFWWCLMRKFTSWGICMGIIRLCLHLFLLLFLMRKSFSIGSVLEMDQDTSILRLEVHILSVCRVFHVWVLLFQGMPLVTNLNQKLH